MDAMEEFQHEGWTFLCSAEQLPDGLYHAVVRYRCPPSEAIRTLSLGHDRYTNASEALLAAKDQAAAWVEEHGGDGRGSSSRARSSSRPPVRDLHRPDEHQRSGADGIPEVADHRRTSCVRIAMTMALWGSARADFGEMHHTARKLSSMNSMLVTAAMSASMVLVDGGTSRGRCALGVRAFTRWPRTCRRPAALPWSAGKRWRASTCSPERRCSPSRSRPGPVRAGCSRPGVRRHLPC